MTLHEQLTKARKEIAFIKGATLGMSYIYEILTSEHYQPPIPKGDFYRVPLTDQQPTDIV